MSGGTTLRHETQASSIGIDVMTSHDDTKQKHASTILALFHGAGRRISALSVEVQLINSANKFQKH